MSLNVLGSLILKPKYLNQECAEKSSPGIIQEDRFGAHGRQKGMLTAATK